MFSHIQTTPDGAFLRKITADALIEWDQNNYCTALALEKDGKAGEFFVYRYFTAAEPNYDPITQSVVEIDPALVNGEWTQQWRIDALTPTQIADNVVAKNAALFRDIQNQTQARLDSFARTRNYSGMLSLCTYVSSTNTKFQAEGQYGIEVRDATWAKLYEILESIETGTRPIPTHYTEIESELPTLIWPQ